MKTIKVSDKGQISIPFVARDAMDIKKGDELVLVQHGDKIYIEKAQKIASEIIDDFSDMKLASEKSLAKIWDNEEDEIWNEYL